MVYSSLESMPSTLYNHKDHVNRVDETHRFPITHRLYLFSSIDSLHFEFSQYESCAILNSMMLSGESVAGVVVGVLTVSL